MKPVPITAAAITAGYTQRAACDVNLDLSCNVVDALFILQCEVGIPNTFCPLP